MKETWKGKIAYSKSELQLSSINPWWEITHSKS
jgi:hypothetical protein